ncbi:MAG: lysoplasmalogenase [Holophagae bacterium]|nr:lysoplasmalogenase [Holophagae bacterium]
MYSKIFLVLFTCVGLLHLIFIVTESENSRHITKILLIPLLMIWTYQVHPVLLLLLALFFGWLGDVLLIKKENRTFLKLGLIAFLMGHLSYISLFLSHSRAFPGAMPMALIFLFYGVFGWDMFLFLKNGLGSMAVPVGAYIFAICVMSISALVFSLSGGGVAWWAFAGSILFVFSDSMLAIQLFRKPFIYGRFLVMATYIPAQFLLAWALCAVSAAL